MTRSNEIFKYLSLTALNHLNFDLLQLARSGRLSMRGSPPTDYSCPRADELLHRRWEADLVKVSCYQSGCKTQVFWMQSQFDIYRDDMLLVDHWLVKSQQSDVILEGGRVVGLVHGLAADLVVLVGKLLALVPHIPLTQANLKSHTGLF